MEKLRRYYVQAPHLVETEFVDAVQVVLASDLAERRKQAREGVAALIERYCGEDDEGDGGSVPWKDWKADFADRIDAIYFGEEP